MYKANEYSSRGRLAKKRKERHYRTHIQKVYDAVIDSDSTEYLQLSGITRRRNNIVKGSKYK